MATRSTPLLQVENVDSYYGQSHILQGLSLHVDQGSVVALLGRNGAGKSTALKSIMGIVAAARGSIRFAGEAIHHLAPHRVARRGIAYVPEDRGIFASLTVDEHLGLNRPRSAGGRRGTVDQLYEEFPLLAERRPPPRQPVERRRAADAGDRTRPHPGSTSAGPRRADRRPGPGGGRAHRRHRPPPSRPRA